MRAAATSATALRSTLGWRMGRERVGGPRIVPPAGAPRKPRPLRAPPRLDWPS
jgi:hypothetical protein